MKHKQFYLLPIATSAAGALLGLLFMSLQKEAATGNPGERAAWVGAFFLIPFLLSFGAMHLALRFGKRYAVTRPAYWWAYALVAGALLFGLGAGGQYLFMVTREETVSSAEVDMVLLLDASSSMDAYGYDDVRTDAATQFVESLSEDCRLQTLAFAGVVVDSSRLLPMNKNNKNSMKQLIAAIDSSGITDFNEPLEKAMATLKSEGHARAKKAVIMLTDGQATLNPQTVNAYRSSDIRVYSIRISGTTATSSDEDALIALAQDTGGFDTLLMPSADGSIDATAMLKAFQDAFRATSDTTIGMREDLLVYAEDGITVLQFFIRALTLIGCAVLTGVGLFGRIERSSVVVNGGMGLAAAVLISVMEGAGYFPCVMLVCLLIQTAYVTLDFRGEEHYHV